MRGPIVSVLVALMWGAPGTVWAQAPSPVRVTRGADARDCPDEDGLEKLIAAVRGDTVAAPATAYTVTFTRSGPTFAAAIRSGVAPPANVRVLEARGQTCDALARAVAVTLALLFDAAQAPPPEATRGDDAPPATTEGQPAPPAPLAPPDAPAPVASHDVRGRVAVGASGLAGVLRALAPAFAGEVGVEFGPWRAGLGVLWALPQDVVLGPGAVRASLVSGVVRACYAPWRREGLRFDVCTGVFAGAATGSGRGYTSDATRTQPWIAAPVELAVAAFQGPLGLELGAGAFAAFRRPDFAIDGIGDAYRSPFVGATLSLRVVARWP